jgi:two-component system, NarL family, sensor histidine kinase UhpB
MRRKLLCLFLSAIYFSAATAQTGKTDSLLKLLSKAGDDTSKVLLYWETGISIIYQNPPGARPYFLKGLALAKKLNFNRGQERCYAATATSYAFLAKYDSQVVYTDSAILFARKVGDPERLALVYLNKGDALDNLQNFSDALKNCDTALIFAERTGNNDRLGRIYYIRGDIFISQGQYSEAVTSLDKAQLFFEKASNIQMQGMCFYNRADIYNRTKKPVEAIGFYKKAIEIAKSIDDISNLSACTCGLAQVYVTQQRFAEAEAMAGQAMAYTKQTGNIMQEAVVHDILSSIHKNQNKYPLAIAEELMAYKILDENNELLRKAATASILADLYNTSGNINEAYKFLKISRDLNDSVVKQQFNIEIARLQTTFDVAQKTKQIELLNKDKELQQQRFQKQRLLLIAAAMLVFLAVMGIWLLMNRNKLKQRMKELELRNQIAADLHDEVGSSLSSIHMLSEMANNVQNDNIHQKNILNKVNRNAKETMDRMSDIVWMIKPGETEAGSLKQRMERFANEICSSKDIQLSMDLSSIENIRLSMVQRKNIYLVFKEAVNNAVKYSGTEKIEVTASFQNQELILQVKDFGKGFDSSMVKKGNGLDNMQHRAKESGGKLRTETAINTGTTIQLVVPV